MGRMEPLQFKCHFTRITSWLPSLIPLGSLCPSCNRFPAKPAHPITPLSLNRPMQKGRDQGALPMNSRLQRNQSPTISRQTARLTLREMMRAHLLQSQPLSHRNHLRLNDSRIQMCLGVPVLFVDYVLTFTMLSIVPVLPISIFYYRSPGNQREG